MVFRGYLHTQRFMRIARWTTNIAHLGAGRFAEIEFPLAPLPEQRRIVEAVESHFTRLDDAVATLERVRANLRRYRASVLKAAVEGRLVPTEAELARAQGRDYEPASVLLERILEERRRRWKESGGRGRYKAPVEPDTDGLPELPEGWCWTSLGQVFSVHVGATPSRKTPAYWGGDIAWVSSGEVQFCRIRSTRESITKEGLDRTSTRIHPPGTVLLGMIGQGRTRGQSAIVDIPACNNQNAAAIRVSETPVPPEFVFHYLWGRYERTRTLGSGNNQQALNKTRVEQIEMPLPPLPEQARIVAEVERRTSVIDALERTAERNLTRCSRLRQSILKWAFEGKLADQDPDDEPASVLLERIRAERDTIKPKKGTRRGRPRSRA